MGVIKSFPTPTTNPPCILHPLPTYHHRNNYMMKRQKATGWTVGMRERDRMRMSWV